MAEVLSPPSTTSSPHASQSPTTDSPDSLCSLPLHARPQPRERVPSYAQNRMSQISRTSQRSRPQSTALEYPAFSSTLAYALVRDFAYPPFHPLHYGAELEASGASTPGSDWNSSRRASDPMEQWNGVSASTHTGWTTGPWGGDGVMYGDPEHAELAALPSTSFGSGDGDAQPLEFMGDEDMHFKKGKHRKSKSYASISDFERGRRRESGRKSRDANAVMAANANADRDQQGIFFFHGQQTDPAGRDSLRQSRSGTGQVENGGQRRDSRYSTLANRSRLLQSSQLANPSTADEASFDPDSDSHELIPLDTEIPAHGHSSTSPHMRDSLGPEDEDLYAGASLALYSFEPENSNELRLVEGQEIMVSYRHGQGWLVAGDLRTGEQGLVPEAYVRLIADMPNYDPERGEFVDVDGDADGEEEDGEEGEVGMGDEVTPVGEEGGVPPSSAHREVFVGEALESGDSSEASDDSPVEMSAKRLEGTALERDRR